MIKNPSSHDIWVEKYRPQTLDDYIGNEQMVDKIKEFIDLGKIPECKSRYWEDYYCKSNIKFFKCGCDVHKCIR